MVVNVRFFKPLDSEFISELAVKTEIILTVEESTMAGGFGSSVLELFNSIHAKDIMVKTIGLPDTFIEHGEQDLIKDLYGINEEGIYQTAISLSRFIHSR